MYFCHQCAIYKNQYDYHFHRYYYWLVLGSGFTREKNPVELIN
jgi:hypothetical protein